MFVGSMATKTSVRHCVQFLFSPHKGKTEYSSTLKGHSHGISAIYTLKSRKWPKTDLFFFILSKLNKRSGFYCVLPLKSFLNWLSYWGMRIGFHSSWLVVIFKIPFFYRQALILSLLKKDWAHAHSLLYPVCIFVLFSRVPFRKYLIEFQCQK